MPFPTSLLPTTLGNLPPPQESSLPNRSLLLLAGDIEQNPGPTIPGPPPGIPLNDLADHREPNLYWTASGRSPLGRWLPGLPPGTTIPPAATCSSKQHSRPPVFPFRLQFGPWTKTSHTIDWSRNMSNNHWTSQYPTSGMPCRSHPKGSWRHHSVTTHAHGVPTSSLPLHPGKRNHNKPLCSLPPLPLPPLSDSPLPPPIATTPNTEERIFGLSSSQLNFHLHRILHQPLSTKLGKPWRRILWSVACGIHKQPLPFTATRHNLYTALRRIFFALARRAHMLGRIDILRLLFQLLSRLPYLNWLLILILKYYPDANQSGELTETIAQRGLGKVGGFHIPRHIWDSFVPPTLPQQLISHKPSICQPSRPTLPQPTPC